MYWTDLDEQTIAYATVDLQGYSKTLIRSPDSRLFGLTLYQNNIYWADFTKQTIEKAEKENGNDR